MAANPPKTDEDKTAPRLPASAVTSLPMKLGTAAVQAWADMGTEAVRFVWDRLQQDLKTQRAMLACTSLEEMRSVQAAFFAAAQEHYADAAARMLDLLGKAAAPGVATPQQARRYDDVPL